MKKNVIALICIIFLSVASVSAAIIVSSNDVSISSSSTTKTNLFDAIEELYGLTGSGCPYGQTCVRCEAGSFADQENNVCTTCVAGTYSEGGVNSCLTCPDGYTSDASAIARTECYIETTAGKFIEIANTSIQLDCPEGSYCPSTKINYGSSGAIYECPSGYTSDSGATQISDCYIQTTAGKYIATANSAGEVSCPANSYCPSTKVFYGNTGGLETCPGSYSSSDAGASSSSDCYLTTSSGYYVSSAYSGQTTCASGGYCPGSVKVYYGSTGGRYSCSGSYTSSSGASSSSSCYISTSSGKYISSAYSSSQSTCTSGYYCPGSVKVYYGNTGGRSSCSGSYTSSSGASSSSDCYITTTAGKYIATAYSSTQSTCTAGNYCPSSTIYYGSTGNIKSCGSGMTSDAGASSSSDCRTIYVSCPSGYTSDGNVTSTSSCYLTTSAGSYVASAYSGQTTCAAGGYCPGGTVVYYGSTGGRTACSGDYTSSSGASSSSDCYITTTAGKYIASAYSSTQSTCTAGNYCPSATIYYGNTGSIQSCGSGKTSDAGASSSSDCRSTYITCPDGYTSSGNVTSNDQCYIQTTAGKYIKTAYSSKQSTCPANSYCPSKKIYYGETGNIKSCPTGKVSDSGSSSESQCVYPTSIVTRSNNNYEATYICQNGSGTIAHCSYHNTAGVPNQGGSCGSMTCHVVSSTDCVYSCASTSYCISQGGLPSTITC